MTAEAEPRGAIPRSRKSSRLAAALRHEFGGFSLRLWLANRITRIVPEGTGYRIRPALLRMLGLKIGAGTLLAGPATIGICQDFHKRIRIGKNCFVNSPVYFDAAAEIVIEDGVSVGHHVQLITSGHEIGPPEFRAGTLRPQPIRIESGAWLGAGVVVLPGVVIGQGAVIAAGAVVARDVPPNVLAAGIPAKPIRSLPVEWRSI